MAKRGRANGRYGQQRRAVTQTFDDVVDGHEGAGREAKERLTQAISTLDVFVGHCFDEESMREMRPKAADALDLLRELVDGTEIYFE